MDVVRKVAIAMCEADGRLPYEQVNVRVEGPTMALVTKPMMAWEVYEADARKFIAAFRALTNDA